MISDMERAFMSNPHLSGKAVSSQIEETVYDTGYADSGIGVVLFRIRVVYRSHRG